MHDRTYNLIQRDDTGFPVKAWTRGVPVDPKAYDALLTVASMPFIAGPVCAMPDIHPGNTVDVVGSVIPTHRAVIPALVGGDMGCGMIGARLSLRADELPDHLFGIRSVLEAAVPHGRTNHGGSNDKGAWTTIPETVQDAWSTMEKGWHAIVTKHPKIARANHINHLGSLGSGNHFIELCLDTKQRVWIIIHSGSRGVGGQIGRYFVELAKEDMRTWMINLPDKDFAYLPEGTLHYKDYIEAMLWAQHFALMNRQLMLRHSVTALQQSQLLPPFTVTEDLINCHHNFTVKEHHRGKNILITRKGAIRAQQGDRGIIPGNMGARTYVVRGKGNLDSYCSCSHGAGRVLTRTQAKQQITLEQHARDTAGVECRKDAGVLEESVAAYKDIDAVMAAQSDLVEVEDILKQVVCIKG